MKKAILSLSLLALTISFTSCTEKKEEKTVIKEVEKESPEKENEGILERSAKKVDDKVNKEIDDKIDEID
ncbi:MAG: hypothetical protein ACTHY4_09475 [Flavobacteriaceae bacterium]